MMKHLFKDWGGKIYVDEEEVGFDEISYKDGDKIHIVLKPKEIKRRRRKINYGGLKKND